MKKFMALALSLIMVLCAVGALAENAEKTELGTLNVGQAFKIQSRVPEGYTFMPVTKTELNMVGILSAGEGKPSVTISIAYNEEYKDTERFNDVDEETVEEIRESFRAADDGVQFEDLETAHGTYSHRRCHYARETIHASTDTHAERHAGTILQIHRVRVFQRRAF